MLQIDLKDDLNVICELILLQTLLQTSFNCVVMLVSISKSVKVFHSSLLKLQQLLGKHKTGFSHTGV